MYDACHINGTWRSKGVGRLKLLYEGGQTWSGGLSFHGGDDPTRHHVLKKKTYHFLNISLHSTKGYSRHKIKVKVMNNLIQPSLPLIKYEKSQNLLEPSSLYPGWCHMYTIPRRHMYTIPKFNINKYTTSMVKWNKTKKSSNCKL